MKETYPRQRAKEIGTQSNNLEQDSDAVSTFLLSHVVGLITSFLIALVYMGLMLKINIYLGYTLEEQFSHEYDIMLEPERKLNSKWMFYYALRDFFFGVKEELFIKVLIYFVGGLFIITKDISIGELLMFISYMTSMEASLDSVMKSKTDFGGQKAVFERLFKIMDEPERQKGQDYPQNATVYLQNVGFTYDGTESNVLENVSCEFENGKKYLLVGKSGEGKSTLIKLLLGKEQPQCGQILFGEILADKIDPKTF